MGHIIISPVPALSRAVLVDQACDDPVYVQSSGSGGIRSDENNFVVAEITFKVAVITFLVVNITFEILNNISRIYGM